ncbi:MAG: hypothetical protein AAFX50_01440 [Acidobacteriota bacterium]
MTFNSGDSEWAAPFEFTRTCGPCEQSDDTDLGNGGTGGGGGGGPPGPGDGGGDGGGTGGGTGGTGGSGGTGGGTGSGSSGGGGSFNVYCDGELAGQASSIADALQMCEEAGPGHEEPPPIPDPGGGGGTGIITDLWPKGDASFGFERVPTPVST